MPTAAAPATAKQLELQSLGVAAAPIDVDSEDPDLMRSKARLDLQKLNVVIEEPAPKMLSTTPFDDEVYDRVSMQVQGSDSSMDRREQSSPLRGTIQGDYDKESAEEDESPPENSGRRSSQPEDTTE